MSYHGNYYVNRDCCFFANFVRQASGPSNIFISPLEPGIHPAFAVSGSSFREIRDVLYRGKSVCFKKADSTGERVWVDLTDLAVQGYSYYAKFCYSNFRITLNRAPYVPGGSFSDKDLGQTVDGIIMPKSGTVGELETVARAHFPHLDSLSTGLVTTNGDQWLDSGCSLESAAVTAHMEQGVIHLHLRKILAEARGD